MKAVAGKRCSSTAASALGQVVLPAHALPCMDTIFTAHTYNLFFIFIMLDCLKLMTQVAVLQRQRRAGTCICQNSHHTSDPQVISTARTCNLIFVVLDCLKPMTHKRIIEKELEGFGIRLNKKPPAINFRKKDKGGINFTSTVNDPQLDLEGAL